MAALSKLYCKLCINLYIYDVIFLDFISHKRILQVVQACVPWWSNNINTDMTKSEWVDNYSTENSFILPACEIWYLCVQKIFWANKTWTHVGTFGFCLWARRLYVSFSPPLRFNVECAFQSHTPFHAMHAWFRNRNFIVANEAFIWSRKKYFLMKKFQKTVIIWIFLWTDVLLSKWCQVKNSWKNIWTHFQLFNL